MAIPEEELLDVVFHGESAGVGFVVPFMINTCIFLTLPISSDCVVFMQCLKEMLCVLFANIFDVEIIDG